MDDSKEKFEKDSSSSGSLSSPATGKLRKKFILSDHSPGGMHVIRFDVQNESTSNNASKTESIVSMPQYLMAIP